MKKFFAAMMAAVMMLGSVPTYALDLPSIPDPPVINLNVFTDVSVDSPYYNALVYLKAEGVVLGYEDGSFKPDQRINRAEFTKMVVIATATPKNTLPEESAIYCDEFQNEDKVTYTNVFKDVLPDLGIEFKPWYATVVCYAKTHNLVNGYPDGYFRPERNINFVETAKIVFNGVHGSGAYVPPSDPNAPWYFTYVDDLSFRHAIPTTINRFDQLITRGEMAEILFRMKTNNTSLSSKTYAELQ